MNPAVKIVWWDLFVNKCMWHWNNFLFYLISAALKETRMVNLNFLLALMFFLHLTRSDSLKSASGQVTPKFNPRQTLFETQSKKKPQKRSFYMWRMSQRNRQLKKERNLIKTVKNQKTLSNWLTHTNDFQKISKIARRIY